MRMPRRSGVAIALLVTLAVAACLRVSGIDQRGPAFVDEGIYTLEGQWLRSFSLALARGLEHKVEEFRQGRNLTSFQEEAARFRETLEGQPPVWGRPGFSLLTALCLGLAGPRMNAANLVSAFFGTLAVLAIFLLARSMYDVRTALLAAFLLALSGYHLIYSVTGLADGSAMCVSLFAVLCYQKALQRRKTGAGEEDRKGGAGWLCLAGLLSGLAFTVHDRFLYVLLVILVNEAIDLRCARGPGDRGQPGRGEATRSPGGQPRPAGTAGRAPASPAAGDVQARAEGFRSRAGRFGKRGTLLGLAFLAPLFLFETPYYLGMVVLRHFGRALPFRTYFEELFSHHLLNFLDAFAFSRLDPATFPEIREAGSRLYNLLTYPYLFYQFNGVAFCVLFLLGLAATVAGGRRQDRLLLVWFLAPFLLLSLGLSVSARYAMVFLPAATLIAARSVRLLERLATASVSCPASPAPPPDPGLQDRNGPEIPPPGAPGNHRLPRRLLRTGLSVLLVLLLAASALDSSREIRAMRCSYEEPVRFLREHGPRHISLQVPVSRAWLGVENVREPPLTMEGLQKDYRDGFRSFLIDYRKFFLRPPFDNTERGRIIADIEATTEPVFCWSHPCYTEPCFLFEVNLFFRLTRKLVREASAMGVDQICIYDLEDYFSRQESVAPAP